MNRLYFGDNLDILREHIADESVDLIYLDPPFNSKRDYSVLFKTPKGHESDAQITAFEDSWHWGEQAEREFNELLHAPNTDVAEMMLALRKFLKENDMMAYLTMMANRNYSRGATQYSQPRVERSGTLGKRNDFLFL
ncbi:MAG: hypothetical protein ACHQNE_05445 [Candidatus Kapaibacterium sp.]